MTTERQEQNAARVRRGIDAFNRGDAEAVLQFFDEDIEIFASPRLANSGTYHGHDGYQRWLAEWLDAWDGYTINVERVEPVGDHHVVAGVLQTARGKGSGIPVEMESYTVAEVRGDKLASMHAHGSRDAALEALGDAEHVASLRTPRP